MASARYGRKLSRLLRELQPDIIHTNGFKMHLLGAWARPRTSPLIWHIHDYLSSRRWMKKILRLFQKRTAAVIVNSKSVAADVQAEMPGLKIVPIYNAIDLNRFSPRGDRMDLDAISGLPPGGDWIRVGLLGTFARWKGHKVFLQALAQLSRELCVRGYVIGDPIYQTDQSQWSVSELKDEVERLGLTGRVGFTGFVADPATALRSLDVVVHASTQPEPFGMVIAEAMASERAVVISNAGGAAELLTDEENGLGHAPGDVDGLARQIDRLARDEALRRRLAAAGRVTAERLYQKERLASEVIAVYRAVAATAPPARANAPAETLASTANHQ
jgi:glycosyltransferase involved in cell wall biosynthesis